MCAMLEFDWFDKARPQTHLRVTSLNTYHPSSIAPSTTFKLNQTKITQAMTTMLKRRKILDGPSTKVAFIKDISTFARVSKVSNVQQFLYKKQDDHPDSDEERKHKPAYRVVKSKKRQREEDAAEEDAGLKEQSGNILRVVPDQDTIHQTPKKKARFARREAKLLETPTKAARSLFETFTISDPKAKESHDQESQDLIDLHSAFLNALAILYAHNGTASPIDIKTLLIPQIELKWGKRRITIEDIQRTLGIQHLITKKSPLSLVQCSKSRTCIEYDPTTSPSASASTTLRVETLKREFLTAITSLSPSAARPLEEIKIHTTPENITLSKGAQRLQEIKATAIAAQAAALPTRSKVNLTTTKTTETSSTSTPVHRATSLLDRILHKQTLASAAPAAPTPEVLARKACLQRLEEIIPILEVLSGSSSSSSSASSTTNSLSSLLASDLNLGLGPRRPIPAKVVSFTMGSVVQHLQGSMRHPMAGEEVERAVRLLADEVAPGWVTVVDIGNVTGVTFRGGVGGRGQWRDKLREMLG